MDNELYEEEGVPSGLITGIHLNVSTQEDVVSIFPYLECFLRCIFFCWSEKRKYIGRKLTHAHTHLFFHKQNYYIKTEVEGIK